MDITGRANRERQLATQLSDPGGYYERQVCGMKSGSHGEG